MNETKPPVVKTPEVNKQMVSPDNELVKSTTLEDQKTFEKMEASYYAQNTELAFQSELEDYDEIADHHVHGAGFDEIAEGVVEEEKGEWDDIDWRKAVISAEILRRPEY